MKTAILAGATGLVGSHVLDLLLDDPEYLKVTVLTRKPLHIEHPKLREVLVNFDELDKHTDQIRGDVVFCCLGTTIKAAGSQEAFKKVDYEYPVKIAELAQQNGAQQYLIITAMGSSKNSIVFYNRVKGEVEDTIAQLHYPSFHILQPSLIIGERNEKRVGEGFAQALAPVFDAVMWGPFSKYKSIKAEQIAKAMIFFSKSMDRGVIRHESDELKRV